MEIATAAHVVGGMMDTVTVARIVGGRLCGANTAFARVTTDTRSLRAGDLFVALRGERFDGHDFVASAFDRGAVAALVADDRASGLTGSLVAVGDPLAALGQLAAHWRAQFEIPVIVVVGSNGKTTVKEMIASVLRAHFGDEAVLATRGNLNNAIGLPLTLLGLSPAHRVAAIELGMNHPGETAELAAIARPTVAVVNNAQREHQEFMKSVADVAAEHAAVLRALPASGFAVINGDDANAALWRDTARAAGCRIVDFALDHDAVVTGACRFEQGATVVDVKTPAGEASIALAAPGRHNVANALAAIAATLSAGVPLAGIVRGLESFRPVAGRLVTTAAPDGVTVIDDTYNANPDSVRAAIDVLATLPGSRWLVLGDMGEVGDEGPAFHREVGAYAQARGIDRLFAAGAAARAAADAFGASSESFAAVEELVGHLANIAPRDVTVLVKGSRFMRMERVVAALLGKASGEAATGGLH